jgi:hypothetical protein
MWSYLMDMYYWQIKYNEKIVGETQPFTIHQMDDTWVKEERNYIIDKNTEDGHKPTMELKRL